MTLDDAPGGRGPDLLQRAAWECGSLVPGKAPSPAQLVDAGIRWRPAAVPGTAAGALRTSGEWHWGHADHDELDGRDWWYRCSFAGLPDEGPFELHLGGLATIADVWFNGTLVLHSENMFREHRIGLSHLAPVNELCIRFASLDALLARRRSRARWKTRVVRSQTLRWYRTSLLGRMPGWAPWAAAVGPWRPVTLRRPGPLVEHHIETSCVGDDGVVRIRARLRASDGEARDARLVVGDAVSALAVQQEGEDTVVDGEVVVRNVARWWPHTHGDQHLYPLRLHAGELTQGLGRVGFRTVDVDRCDGAFTLTVNGVPVFCRGACWVGPDTVSLAPRQSEVRASLEMVRDAGMNMVRVGGYTVYEDEGFLDSCDDLGLLVWQDCMLAGIDPPEDPDFHTEVRAELAQALGRLQGRPSVAVICGSSEIHQQAAMLGMEAERWTSPLLEEVIPAMVGEMLPGTPYVPSTPTGEGLPFRPGSGVAHYFGVGAYLRPLDDARLSGVRFAAECLAFATPPEPTTILEAFGGSQMVGHHPAWKLGVPRDAGTAWDFEDVRDHYVRELFGVEPAAVRYSDPERYLDLGRAAVAELVTAVMSEWRPSRSPCAGGLVLAWRDLWPGAGWGLIDALGRPKAPWYALRRVLAPVALLLSDEGLGGLGLHAVNDGPTGRAGEVEILLYNAAGVVVEGAAQPIELAPRATVDLDAEAVLGGFRDVTWAYRFGPVGHDVVATRLSGEDGETLAEAVYLPGGRARPRQVHLGLTAVARPGATDDWQLTVSTELFAQWVAIDVPGFLPADSWFHLLPGQSRTVALHPETADGHRPSGEVRALNAAGTTRVVVEGERS